MKQLHLYVTILPGLCKSKTFGSDAEFRHITAILLLLLYYCNNLSKQTNSIVFKFSLYNLVVQKATVCQMLELFAPF